MSMHQKKEKRKEQKKKTILHYLFYHQKRLYANSLVHLQKIKQN
jgi:hypothetical protein